MGPRVAVVAGVSALFLAACQPATPAAGSATPPASMHTQAPTLRPQAPTPPTTWLTYEATGLYGLSYPGDIYSVIPGPASAEALWPGVALLQPTDAFNSRQPLSVTYSIAVAVGELSADRLQAQPTSLLSDSILVAYNPSLLLESPIREASLGGVPAYRAENLPAGLSGLTIQIVAIHNGRAWELLVQPHQLAGDPEANLPLVEQIISTFRFLE